MKKFVFNKEKLRYDEQKVSFWEILGKAAVYIILSVGIAILYYAVFSLFFSNGKEKKLQQENEYLEVEVQAMEEKVALVDDVVKSLDARDKSIYRQIFNSEPPQLMGDVSIIDSLPDLDALYLSDEFDLIKQTDAKCSDIEREVTSVKKNINSINNRINSADFVPTNFPSIIPVKNFTLAQTGASVGMKMHPYYKTLVMHTGIDLIAPLGTEVLASADGTVVKIERLNKGFGNTVTIDHGNGFETYYAHLGDIYVRNGQVIKQGSLIGRVGTSGTVFASSLHYEVRRGGEYMDPINFFFASLSPSMYFKMMQIATNTGQSLD
ncbi:MAG: M23 family metallopeptidase [Bacteroidales bacterium]|nr:M23 family metallopeptidase [Bacteroidales bacterium]